MQESNGVHIAQRGGTLLERHFVCGKWFMDGLAGAWAQAAIEHGPPDEHPNLGREWQHNWRSFFSSAKHAQRGASPVCASETHARLNSAVT